MTDQPMTSTKPYLVRAFHQWILDNDLTPYVVIDAKTPFVQVPKQYIEDDRIVLNISPHATDDLEISNSAISFEASFGGMIEQISAPITEVLAIYAMENGRGIVFGEDEFEDDDGNGGDLPPSSGGDTKSKGKPSLRVVK